jgi:uncharacterized heparinase superfamily protein
MATAATIFHTVRHLRAVQIYRRLYRPRPKVRQSHRAQTRQRTGNWADPITRPVRHIGRNRFRILNQERQIQTWNDAGVPKLWLYNLHYLDHPTADLIEQWIADNPVGTGNGWEPYPIAIRIVNWMKWALNGGNLGPAALDSLHLQAEYLSQSLEHHLGANHLFADAVALTIAGLYFVGDQPQRWFRVGTRLLRRELQEQVLSDGGHYERSPMYHALLLESMLDVLNTARAFAPVADSECCFWSEKASAMLTWLNNMAHPDGRISFFNDAAFEIAPEPSQLIEYASRLGVHPAATRLGESGYVRLVSGDAVVVFDAAPVGPDHQPGHAHADTLSFEMSHRGQRVLVNSGTSTYEKGCDRDWQRGTAAHNTVRIDGLDQSEVWSIFRVARRARPFEIRTDGRTFVAAAHDGYRRMREPVVHRRCVQLSATAVTITDRIEGRGRHRIETFFHLHPEANPDIHLDPKLSVSTEPSFWYPEFNRSVPNTTVIGTWTGACPIEFRNVISLQ